MTYRIGVRRRFLPFFKVYAVTGHQTEIFGASNPRLVLTCADGSIETIPRIDRRQVRVYPEYTKQIQELAEIEALKAAQVRVSEFQEL